LQRDKNFLQNENLQRDKNFLQNENLQRSEKFLQISEKFLRISSRKFLLENLKNNLGIKSILALIFQIEELREEVVQIEYKDHKYVEYGLKYIKIEKIMKNQRETDESIVPLVSKVLLFILEISSQQKFLKTMFNTIFILQKINKLEDKFFNLKSTGGEVLLECRETEFPVVFFIIYEDSSFETLEIASPGIYKLVAKQDTIYILCNKTTGYEKVTIG
ncbi:hypothetical protein NGRA_0689, partial [Nosema granulosis]